LANKYWPFILSRLKESNYNYNPKEITELFKSGKGGSAKIGYYYVSPNKEKDKVSDRRNSVCPVEIAGSIDNRIRRWLQNPQKILRPFIKEGMTVLDIGCGTGFFSVDMA